jgi:phenylacetate-CoA ligase
MWFYLEHTHRRYFTGSFIVAKALSQVAEKVMPSWLHKAYWNAFTLWHFSAEARLPYRPLAELQAIQNRRVRAMIAHAYETVPYYREVMDKTGLRPGDFLTAEDLARLPILTGDHLARDPERFLSRRYANGRGLQLHSSGTAGRLRKINYDAAALFLALAHGRRQRLVLAQFVRRPFGYRSMVVSRPGSIGFLIHDFYRSYSLVPRILARKRNPLSPGETFEDNIARLEAMKPEVLVGYGSYLGLLFRRAWERHLPIFRPKVVVYGGDHLADADRLLIETEFGVPVVSSYQAAEALHIAFQCERRQGFHIGLDYIAVRVVDKNGNPVGPGGTGEIIISNLTNRATVLLNYQQGDVVTLSEGPCPCGRTLPTIARIDGRADDLIALPGGQLIHSLVVLALLHRVPGVIQVQLIQEDLQRFLLRAVCIGAKDWSLTSQELAVTLRSILGENITVALERVEAIPPQPNGKVKAVISHCRS